MNKVLVFTLFGLILAANVHAGPIITVEPDSFANGLDIQQRHTGSLFGYEIWKPRLLL